MILKILLNTRIICMIFIQILKNAIQIRNVKHNFFDDMIIDMSNNKKPNPIVTEVLIRRRKLHISLVFIAQSYFVVTKSISISIIH